MAVEALKRTAPIDTKAGAIEQFRALFAEIAKGAGKRDAERIAPHAEIAALKQAGFGAVRLPRGEGGLGLTFVELMGLVVELAQADSNVAHILRNHFGAVESALANRTARSSSFVIEHTRAGETFGGAFSELGSAQAGGTDFSTTFAADGKDYRLNGTKFYSTGNLYADWLSVTGRLEDGRQAVAIVQVGRPGVELVDDWDGIGQRLTGSGTTRFVDVAVSAEELVAKGNDVKPGGKYQAVFAQLYLSAAIAGILAAVRDDATVLAKNRGRNFYHGIAEKPRDEPGVQELIGQISTNAWLAATLARDAAEALQRAQDFELAYGPNDDLRMQASIIAARLKIVVDELAPSTASLLFEVGGGSTVSQALHFDRHWRNIKTLSAHNPRNYKLRVIGDYELNGTPLPVGPFF